MIAGWRLAAALGALLALTAAGAGLYLKGRADGRALGQAEQAAANERAERLRRGDDAKLNVLSDYDLCVAGLRGNGMPADACEQLRGL